MEKMMYCLKGHEMRIMTSVPENAKCYACARSFSSEVGEALYYTCTDCDVMIHRKCAKLPKQIDHPMHPKHPLFLFATPPYGSKTCECQGCKKSWENSVYHCSSCEFDIDILCAFIEDDDIMIPTHHHPVRLIPRPASFKCNACDVKVEDNESYMCTKPSCWFWIHKICGSLPDMLQHPDHSHPLLLATSVPVRYRKYKFTCEICHEDLGSNAWIYHCQRCKYFMHLRCIATEAPLPLGLPGGTIYIPPVFPMIRQLKTIVKQVEPHKWLMQDGPQLPEVMVDSHKHSLVLNSGYNEEDEDGIICDGCIEPITSPYYKCGQFCNFFLHTTCATLPNARGLFVFGHSFYPTVFELYFPETPWEAVTCFACKSSCNGYSYKCRGCNAYLDIKCCYLESYITHVGHKHYLLKSENNRFDNHKCSCCGESAGDRDEYPHYYCEPCKFVLGFECATLPATVKHGWDKHTLVLSFPPHIRDTDEGEEFYCEVCEEEIHPKHWMYRCAECDHSFHPRCIPTLGESRNIKFGKTVSIRSHPHPLTLVPQAKLTSRCHTCRKSLQWSRCFECADCGFYLCPECIPKEEVVME